MEQKKTLCKKLEHDFDIRRGRPINFFRSEWEIYTANGSYAEPSPNHGNKSPVSTLYLIFHLVFFLYFFCFTIYDLCQYPEIHLFFIYLTNWTLTLQVVYATIYSVRLSQIRIRHCYRMAHGMSNTTEEDYGKKLQWPEIVIWFLYDLVGTYPYIVALVFWTAIYDPKNNIFGTSSIILHASTAVMAFFSAVFVAIPVRISHFLVPVAFGVLYGIFTFIYEKVDFKYSKESPVNIYPFIDWNNAPWKTFGLGCGCLLMTGGMHFCACWGLYKLRRYIKICLFERNAKKGAKDGLEDDYEPEPSLVIVRQEEEEEEEESIDQQDN